MKVSTFIISFLLIPCLGWAQTEYRCGCLLPEKFAPVSTVYESAKVYDYPSKNASVVGTMYFGQPTASYLDEKVETIEDKKRTYAKVALEDGTQGWVSSYSLVLCGQGRVVGQTTSGYKSSELKERSGATFKAGEPIVVTEEVDGYIMAYSKDKTRQGWIPVTHTFEGAEEVKTALALQRILNEKDASKRKKRLKDLEETVNQGLQMAGFVHTAYQENPYTLPTQTAENTETLLASNTRDLKEKAIAPSLPKQKESPIASTEKKESKKETQKTPKSEPAKTPKKVKNESPTLSRELPSEIIKNDLVKTQQPNTKEMTARTIPAPTSIAVDKGAVKEKVAVCTQYYKYSEKLLVSPYASNNADLICYHPTLPEGAKVQLELPEGGVVLLHVMGKSTQKGILQIPTSTLERLYGAEVPKEVMTTFFANK